MGRGAERRTDGRTDEYIRKQYIWMTCYSTHLQIDSTSVLLSTMTDRQIRGDPKWTIGEKTLS